MYIYIYIYIYTNIYVIIFSYLKMSKNSSVKYLLYKKAKKGL